MQCIVVNVSERDDWLYQTEHSGRKREVGLHVPKKVRPGLIHESREDAEREAARLACESGGYGSDFAVFELVGIVRGKVLADTDRIKGIGPCGALVPKWQTEALEV
jgi:hypothetical protein